MPGEATDLLRDLGHDAKSIQELNLQGTKNGDIYRLTQTEDRILVTLDLDFANILNYPTKAHPETRNLVPKLNIVTQQSYEILLPRTHCCL